MKTLLTLIALSLCGCGTSSIMKNMQDDKASLSADVQYMGQSFKIKRINPGPGQSARILPDGTMVVEWVGGAVATNTPVPVSLYKVP